jgi:hypothetical protein
VQIPPIAGLNVAAQQSARHGRHGKPDRSEASGAGRLRIFNEKFLITADQLL